jgi:hypothetical protein
MRLTEAQIRELFDKHGVCVTEACDKCGKILRAIRYTRQGQSGEWCSRLCRDGVERKAGACRGCGVDLNGKRKGALFCSDACRMRQRVQDRRNNPKTPIEKSGLTDAILPFGYGGSLNSGKLLGEALITN